jgi:hypothetical protein
MNATRSSSGSEHVPKKRQHAQRAKKKARPHGKAPEAGLDEAPVDEEASIARGAAAALKQTTAELSACSAELHHQLTVGDINQAAAAYAEVEQLAGRTYEPLAQLSIFFEPNGDCS